MVEAEIWKTTFPQALMGNLEKRGVAGDFSTCLGFKPGPRHIKAQFELMLWN